jgi:hypothetical protein
MKKSIQHQITADTDRRLKRILPRSIIQEKASLQRRMRLYNALYYEKEHKKRVKCTLEAGEYAQLAKQAIKTGDTPTAFLKKAAFAYLNKKYLVPQNIENSLEKLSGQIRKIGNNLNQIAARTNTLKKVSFGDLNQAKKELERLESAFERFIKEPPQK